MPATSDADELLQPLVAALLRDHPPGEVDPETFRGAQFDRGLAWVHHPEGLGGLGLPVQQQAVVDDLLAEAGAPGPPDHGVIGYGMAAPVLLVHGTESQQRRYLRPLFTGAEVWCQLFSEPGAGSDVAALATSARRDGDNWVVNGQKVWTSFAQVADFGLLAARTDPAVPKHRGITYFVMNMRADGVEVRPLRQLTGDAEFNEVFFVDAQVPDGDRLGAVDGGWPVVLTTLMNERVMISGALQRGAGPIQDALALWQQADDHDPVSRDRLVQLWIEAECLRLTTVRAAEQAKAGTPGPEGAVGKLAATLLNQRIYDLCMDLLGPDATLYDLDVTAVREDPRWQFLRSKANTIEGGTSEIMRNILAERVLGLPAEPRTDRDRPWRDVPRS
ncbi:acyl-CoA dehydrogenase family protein [Kribbella sp. NPDC051952]|uniref:acyl-CoA dehydrogenase family protein n=1 Tax=Kribbella sp. NPDC051952 TaxID=3154851 RepID=UPI00342ED4AA